MNANIDFARRPAARAARRRTLLDSLEPRQLMTTVSETGILAASNLAGTGSSSSSISMKWTDNATNESNYNVWRSTDVKNWSKISTLNANATSFTDTGLSASKTYYYAVRAYNSTSGDSISSNMLTATTSASSTSSSSSKPAAPSNLTSTSTGTSSVGLKWTDNASNESTYVVYRSTGSSGSWSPIASLAANTTTYTVTGLAANTQYSFLVRAINNAGSSPFTNTLTVKTASSASGSSNGGSSTVTKPSAPTGVSASTTGTTSVKVAWSDASGNETGFTVYRSTDNANFTAIAWLGAGTTSYSATGLSASTKYYFKVAAYNDAGSNSSGSVNATTSSGASSSGGGSSNSGGDSVTSAGLTNPFAMSGIVQNEVPFSTADKAMKDLGIKSVRLWYSVGSWTSGPNSWDISRAQQYKNAGYTVVLAVVAKTVTDYGTAKAYFDRLMSNSTARSSVDYWEIGNEPNVSSFWNSSLQKYVTNYLKPAWDAIHPYGEKVIGGGVSWDANAAAEMQKYGYSNYCDYAGFHPYGESGAIVVQRAQAARAAFGGKQLIVTEWNVQRVSDLNKWAKEITIAAKGLQNVSYLNYYYALEADETHVGKGGVIHSNGSHNTLFWNEIYSWLH